MELEQKVSIDSFLRGKDLWLVPINKLEQLRKYIFDIETERIQSEQVSNSKGKFVGIGKTISIKSVSRGNQLFVWFFDRKKSQKVCCCHFETIKDHRSNV